MEMDFPAQNTFQKFEQVTDIQFCSSAMTNRHCWLSLVMFQSVAWKSISSTYNQNEVLIIYYSRTLTPTEW